MHNVVVEMQATVVKQMWFMLYVHIMTLKVHILIICIVKLYCILYNVFMPYIMYCAEVWGNTYAINVQCLVLLQKRVIRLLCGAKRLDHTNILFYDLRILKVPDLVKLKTAVL